MDQTLEGLPLEQVLPYMRAGAEAVNRNGLVVRIAGDVFHEKGPDGKWKRSPGIPTHSGWTLVGGVPMLSPSALLSGLFISLVIVSLAGVAGFVICGLLWG